MNAARPKDDPFSNPSTPAEILASFKFSEIFPNPNPADLSIHYYHMFGLTQNYIILPMNSVIMKAGDIIKAMMNKRQVFEVYFYKIEGAFFETSPTHGPPT